MLFARDRSAAGEPDPRVVDNLKAQLADRRERNVFLVETIRSLLVFLKDFSMDIHEGEVDSRRFRQDINALGEKFATTEKTRSLAGVYNRYRKKICAFISGQKACLAAREAELKEIIDLLTRAMASLDADNQVFNQAVYRQTEKIERVHQPRPQRQKQQTQRQSVLRARTGRCHGHLPERCSCAVLSGVYPRDWIRSVRGKNAPRILTSCIGSTFLSCYGGRLCVFSFFFFSFFFLPLCLRAPYIFCQFCLG